MRVRSQSNMYLTLCTKDRHRNKYKGCCGLLISSKRLIFQDGRVPTEQKTSIENQSQKCSLPHGAPGLYTRPHRQPKKGSYICLHVTTQRCQRQTPCMAWRFECTISPWKRPTHSAQPVLSSTSDIFLVPPSRQALPSGRQRALPGLGQASYMPMPSMEYWMYILLRTCRTTHL